MDQEIEIEIELEDGVHVARIISSKAGIDAIVSALEGDDAVDAVEVVAEETTAEETTEEG